jgi:hypothetical protein
MLNLLVTMQTGNLWIIVVLSLAWVFQGAGNVPFSLNSLAGKPKIDSPLPGEALQGVVSVSGSTDMAGFQSSELAFSYDQEGSTWSVIAQSKDPAKSTQLGSWDTTTITDGLYRLRIRVQLDDGTTVETLVSGLRVRNYSAIETATPVPEAGIEPALTITPQVTPTSVLPSATALPPNPAQVTQVGLVFSMARGAAFVVVGFVLLGAYTGVRVLSRRVGKRKR